MDWIITVEHRTRATHDYLPTSAGKQAPVMDDGVADTSNSYNEAVLNVDLSGAQRVLVFGREKVLTKTISYH